MEKHLKRLQYNNECIMNTMEDKPRPVSNLAPGPFNQMLIPTAMLAIVQVYSSCSSNATIAVLVRIPLSLLVPKARMVHDLRRTS